MHEHTAKNLEPAAQSHVAFDETDPHGAQAGHHEHHVNGWKTLLGILCVLLFFTALTVAVSQTEIWVAGAWGLQIPNWINVAGAMSIAVVKATLVCMYFMQLKHDKALNSIVLLFSLFCVGLFLFFTMADLGNRDLVTDFKNDYGVEGGTGEGLSNTIAGKDAAFALAVAPKVSTGGSSLVDYRRQQAIENWPPYKGEDDHRHPKYDYEAHPDKYAFARKYYEDPYYLGDNTTRGFWHFYYEKNYLRVGKTPHRHPFDDANYFASFATRFAHDLHEAGLHAHVDHEPESDADRSRPRLGLTHAVDTLLTDGGDHHADDHTADHDTHEGGDHDATGNEHDHADEQHDDSEG